MEAWAAEHDETPWSPWNSARGFIIMAPDEAAARHAASNRGQLFAEPWWLDPALTRCEEIRDDGRAQILLTNMPTG